MNDSGPTTDGMIASRRRDSQRKRSRVIAALEQMIRDQTPITFAAVARQAQVSTWLVYADGVREAIENARNRHKEQPRPETCADTRPGLATDLALAREEITRLRAERDELRGKLRLSLGAQLDGLHRNDLTAKVDELTAHNQQLVAAEAQVRSENEALHARVSELEDDLTAARTSLRRMIRGENRGSGPTT